MHYQKRQEKEVVLVYIIQFVQFGINVRMIKKFIIQVCDYSKIQSVIDIGTGAGFPGIPLKIAFPEIEVVLLDSLNKNGMIKRNERIVLAGFGAGLTWGAAVIQW